ncbi:hypothetical protein C5B86_19450 [Haloferax sp. Atlit-19N]|uniref:hypothetical protein n=1 Tax=Haloferax sp. Atlit-19N TaxID=2077201 RepID=UPI000E26BA13|nr:hypothetical protein [Haloferax sp. Atlit-19N]RDZ39349.1 hypothetical protein C5B86_19450 [Haloferax sp. Atlit-19N]
MQSNPTEGDLEKVEYPAEFFASRDDATPRMSHVRPVNQQLAKAVIDPQTGVQGAESAFQLSNDDEDSVVTVYRVADEAYIVEVYDRDKKLYYEATSDALSDELFPKLATGEWTIETMGQKTLDTFLASL